MNPTFVKYTPVKHKIEGYKGWVDGTTNMRELFTGNKECKWQYRIEVQNEEDRRIAPEEDLVPITEHAEYPPSLTIKKKSGFQEETRLHALGYKITDMEQHERWYILINVAIPILGVVEVVKTILDNMAVRSIWKNQEERYKNALKEWSEDLDMIIERFNDSTELKNRPDLIGRFKESRTDKKRE